MNLRERYVYLNELLEKAEKEYAGNNTFSTELEIASLKKERQELSSKIIEEQTQVSWFGGRLFS